MHKKRKVLAVLLVVVSLAFLGCCAAFGWMCYRVYQNSRQMEAETKRLLNENSEMLQEIQMLQEQMEDYEKAQAEAAQKREEAESTKAEAQELTLNIDLLEPGSILDTSLISGNESLFFKAYDIVEGDAVYNRINGKSYRENPNVQLSDLKYLKIIHYNFNQQIQVGEMIVNAAIYQDVLSIFRELFDVKYEVQSIYLVDNYWTGDGGTSDSASIDVNNTSCFNYREVTGGSNLSNHAYGCAIDINPQQNPYVWFSDGVKQWSHTNADSYIENRDRGDLHIIVEGDICYSIFTKYGFSWGGNWSNPIDYQHFEKEIY